MNNSNIRIYQSEDGKTEINVQLDNETVWLSLTKKGLMQNLFPPFINGHSGLDPKSQKRTKRDEQGKLHLFYDKPTQQLVIHWCNQ